MPPNDRNARFLELCAKQPQTIAKECGHYEDERIPDILYCISRYVLWYEAIEKDLINKDLLINENISLYVNQLISARNSINESIEKILKYLKNDAPLRSIRPSTRIIMLERDAIYEEFYRVTGRLMPEPMEDN